MYFLRLYYIPLNLSIYFRKQKSQARGLAFYHFILNYREATSTLTPGPKVVVTATLRTY